MVEAGTVDDSCKERGRGDRKAERREMEEEEQREETWSKKGKSRYWAFELVIMCWHLSSICVFTKYIFYDMQEPSEDKLA